MRRNILAPCLFLLGCLAIACTSGPSAETPGMPSPSPTPQPDPTPPPPPATRIIEFTPDTATPVGEAIGLRLASRGQQAGKLALAVTAFNISNHTNLSGMPGVNGIWGRVMWNESLLESDNTWEAGDFLRQGGVQPQCCTPGEANITQIPGTFPFSVQRAPTVPPNPQVTGSGEIVLFRLQPRAGVTQGTGRVEFTIIGGSFQTLFRFRPLNQYPAPENTYGGTFTIR